MTTGPARAGDPGFEAFRHARESRVEAEGFEHRTLEIPLSVRHGARRIAEVLGIAPAHLAALAREDGELAPTGAVFFDVETTGFAGDDTLVFLAGAMTIDSRRAIVEQWLLVEEAAEDRFLAALRPRLLGSEPLVTFVGKSFDRHRLDDRFQRHFGERPLAPRRHADLYHAARRLYRGALADFRLVTIERERLGVHRAGDLRGAECPEAWLDFVETRDRRFIEPVLRHNALDLLALASLLVALCDALRAPASLAEHAAVANFLHAAGRDDLAAASHARLLRAEPGSDPAVEAARRIAARRAGAPTSPRARKPS